MADLNSILRKHGYRPELGRDRKSYERALVKLIPKDRLDEFDAIFLDHEQLEERLHAFAAGNVALLRLLYSTQLHVSMALAKELGQELGDLVDAVDVLELGGADGWLLDHLVPTLPSGSTGHVVDGNPAWAEGCNWPFTTASYTEADLGRTFKVIVSVLGASVGSQEDLLSAVVRHMAPDGCALLGLRIPREEDFVALVDHARSIGLALDAERSRKVEVTSPHGLKESFHVVALRPADNMEPSAGVWLGMVRLCYHNAPRMRNMMGVEARFLAGQFVQSPSVFEDTATFADGDLHISVHEVEGVLVRICRFPSGVVVVQYPVDPAEMNTTAMEWHESLPIEFSH